MNKLYSLIIDIPVFFMTLVMITNLLFYNYITKKYDNSKSICDTFMKFGSVDQYGWVPRDCSLHTYTKKEGQECFIKRGRVKENYIVFFGDSRTKHLYYDFESVFFDLKGITEDFNFFNSIYSVTITYNRCFFYDKNEIEKLEDLLNPNNVNKIPDVIVAAVGIHIITHKSKGNPDVGFEEYRNEITKVARVLNQLAKKTTVIYIQMEHIIESIFKYKRVKNWQITRCNDIAREVLNGSQIMISESSWKLAQANVQYYRKDGNHPGKIIIHHKTQMILNFYCNDIMRPSDATCCVNKSSKLPIHYLKIFITCNSFIAIGIVIFLIKKMKNRNHNSIEKSSVTNTNSNKIKICLNIVKFSFIIGYLYVAEKSMIFQKNYKIYSFETFAGPLIILFFIGCFFIQNKTKKEIMHRYITDELKGWMQLVLIFYHVSGASKILPIYTHIRVLVSMYVFLTGYGHCIYYWRGGSMNFSRYFQVIFRMNFLTIFLCILMNNSYMFYYFVPIISFWFTIGYILLSLPPKRGKAPFDISDYSIIIYKLILLSIIIIIMDLIKNVYFPEYSGKYVIDKTQGSIYLNIRELCFRLELDKFSLVYGILFGLIIEKIQGENLAHQDGTENNFVVDNKFQVDNKFDLIKNFNKYWRNFFLIFISIFLFTFYEYIANITQEKIIYNTMHPYITWMPILSYIILRNLFQCVRNNVSSLMVWFGKISLELFICQYHCLLSNDTTKVLELFPNYPIANLITTFLFFVVISNECHEITLFFTKLFVKKDNN